MEHVRACPRARELLGDGIRVSWFGWACDVNEEITLPVAGSRASGSYSFHRPYEQAGDVRWRVRGALEVGEETIDLQACIDAATNLGPMDTELLGARCDAGQPAACLGVGAMLEEGRGFPADPDRARARYEQACRAGLRAACLLRDRLSR
jgi:TPR repeat protein